MECNKENLNFKENLKNAICNNDIKYLEEKRHLYSIDERFEDENNDTLLLYSVSDEKSKVYKYFLTNNADIQLTNDEGENIIHAIVFSGDIERLKEIISNYPTNIDHRANDGSTPLLLAISLGDFNISKALIEYGANVNITDNEGIGPLHLAAQSGDLELVKCLLESGADFNFKTNNGNLPLALAVNANHADIIKILYNRMYGSI